MPNPNKSDLNLQILRRDFTQDTGLMSICHFLVHSFIDVPSPLKVLGLHGNLNSNSLLCVKAKGIVSSFWGYWWSELASPQE